VKAGPTGTSWLVALVLALACSREAEVEEGDPLLLEDTPIPRIPDGGVPSVLNGELASPDLPACADRPIAARCEGSNDFPCRVSQLVPIAIDECQAELTCRATDWLTLSMDGEGCFSDIGMTRPDPALIACLVRILGGMRCPCDAQTLTQYLGFGTGNCSPMEPPAPIE